MTARQASSRSDATSGAKPGSSTLVIAVRPDDIDHIGHVNNAVYLRWTQDAVVHHWERIADPEAVARYLWVALKHEITYRRPAFLGDAILAHTHLQTAGGAKARFQTMIQRGQEVLAQVDSLWCCIDRDSRRAVRLPRLTLARFTALA